jgi:exodeoxyribonuclease-3
MKKGYSGTAILSKIKPIGVEYPEKQGRVICAEFEGYFVVCVYVQNSGTNIATRTDFDNFFREFIRSKTKPVIAVGDFNVIANKNLDIHSPKIKNTPGAYDFEIQNFKKLLELFRDTFREKFPNTIKFSWWSNFSNCRARGIGWRIDYILVSPEIMEFVEISDILTEHLGSDHAPIYAIINL